jgi:hypothetical protein
MTQREKTREDKVAHSTSQIEAWETKWRRKRSRITSASTKAIGAKASVPTKAGC